jgi:hypothetical protein
MNPLTFTASQILDIPMLEPERLFGMPTDVQATYHALARRWHPDMPTGDPNVFARINELHGRAKHLVEIGTWHVPGLFEFTAAGKQYRVHYLRSFDFELGKAFLGKTLITYVITKDFADLTENARKIITGLRYPDNETREVMGRYLPKLVEYHETATDVVIVIAKPADLIRMRDLLTHLGGKIDGKHVAWMVSRMLNLASYLEWAGLTHNDLSLDTLFVCPEHHTVCLLGGWWYAAPVNDKLTAVPIRTLNHSPREVITSKRASLRIDPELVRLTGRELLGDASGMRLVNDPDVRKQIVDWLRMSGPGSAIQDYTQWRERILGPRKFVRLPVSATDVYAELA